MSNFERRLSAIHKRPSIGPGASASPGGAAPDVAGAGTSSLAVEDTVGSLGWEAAERVSRILDVEPGTMITLSVAGPAGSTSLEVAWDADGMPMIREL